MDCKTFEGERVLKASGEAATPEFEAHLAGCAACRADVAEFRDLSRLYHESSDERLPAAVVAALRRRPTEDLRARLNRGVRFVGAMAAAGLVAALLWALLLKPRPVEPAPGPSAVLVWDPMTPAGEFLIPLDLDDRLRALRMKAGALAEGSSEVDRRLDALKSRVSTFKVDKDSM
jgi:hypothetical protein